MASTVTRNTETTVPDVTVHTVTSAVTSTVSRPSRGGERRAESGVRIRERVPNPNLSREPRLSRADLDAWATFGREWDPFKAAWLERFRMPPMGSAEDDDEHPSQRSMLYQVLDAWPTRIADWVREAPRGASAAKVVPHVLTRWHSVRDAVADDESYDDLKRLRRAQMSGPAAASMARLRDVIETGR